MNGRSFLLPLTAALLLTGFPAGVSLGAGTDSIDGDLERLRGALVPTDHSGLVNFLRLRTEREPSREALSRLIENLHSPTAATRQQACADLVAIGKPALPLLRAVVPSNADERALVRGCMKAIQTDRGTLTVAAVHVLAHRHSAGTASELLAYLPYAENESVLEEIQDALSAVTYDRKGVADPAIVKALDDKHPSRRAAAIVALTQIDAWQHREQLRKLLRDPAPSVRFRAARALTRAAEPESVSTLVSLLSDPDDQEMCAMVESVLTDLAGEMRPDVSRSDDETLRRKAKDVWAKWWRDTEGTGLLDELKRRTPTDADRARVQALIEKLGDDSFQVRQKATQELVRLEELALPLLKKLLKEPPDLEMRMRSERCVASIEKARRQFLSRIPAIGRLIALRNPPGSAETILAYLPYLEDDGLIEELEHTLDGLALSGDKSHPALLKALSDKSWIRRAAAAQALCAGRRTDHVEAVRKLLKDAEPAVRLKVAVVLTGSGDADAVPALISLVAELPPEQSAQAEDFLNQLAGAAGPENLPENEDDRKGRSEAWTTWWKANRDKVALADPALERFAPELRTSVHGYTLLVQPQTNTVTELGRDGKPRWTLTNLSRPRDAQVLPGQRVLVAERNKVTVRDLRGKIVWEKEIPQPLSVQRLGNGNFFVTCPTQLIEVGRSGKDVQNVKLSQGVVAARKLPDGRIVAFSTNTEVVQLDRNGRELKRIPVDCGGAGCNEVLDNGHVLALSPGNGNLIEFDIDGKEVHRFDVSGAAHAFRLPNGHTLLTVGGSKYIELDKKWRPVNETALPTAAFRVKRR
jgi:HEAT repeat protein